MWKAKREELLVTIRSEGIEVDEKIVLAYSNPKARDWDRGAEIMIRNDLRKDLAIRMVACAPEIIEGGTVGRQNP